MKQQGTKLFYGYIVVLAAFCISTASWGTFYSFGVFFKPLATEFHWTSAMTSGAFSLCVITYGSLGIIIGRLTDKFGPRIIVTVCGFFIGSCFLLMSQIGAIWQLYLFYGVVLGIGLGGGFVPLVSIVPRWFVKRRGLMTGIVVAGIGLGTLIMPPIASRLIYSYGWSTSYIIVGIIALVGITLPAQFLKRDPSQVSQLADRREVVNEALNLEAKGLSLREALHTKQFWIICVSFLIFGMAEMAVMVHIANHAIQLEIPPITAANILTVIGALSILGRIIMGSTADRTGSRLVFTICFILLTLALFWLQLANELSMLYLFAAVFGFTYGGLAALMSPLIAEIFGLRSIGTLIGYTVFSFTIGGAIGPLLAGYIFDTYNSYQTAFLVFAALSTGCLVLSLFLRPLTINGNLPSDR